MNPRYRRQSSSAARWGLAAALVALLIVAGACTTLTGALMAPAAHGSSLITPDPNATATPTPFGPQAPTPATGEPAPATPQAPIQPGQPWGNYLPPSEPSAIEIRPPMAPLQVSEGTVNIIIMGSDQRPDEYGHRTDTLILLSLDPKAGKVRMLSFPRDLYVYIPGNRVNRINVADAYGGPEMVANTILYNFGLEVHHWVRVNFNGFTHIVDSLGGIDVEVGGYLQDECGRPWSYSPGTYHMDGFQALCYVRMRKTTGDFDRLRRQQEVMLALFKRVVSLDGLARAPELWQAFSGAVETDMQLADALRMLPLAGRVAADPSRIERYAVTADMGLIWRVPTSGASVILPDWERIEAMLYEAFEGQPAP